MERFLVSVLVGITVQWTISVSGECVPSRGCLALAFYRISLNEQLNAIYSNFDTNLTALQGYNDIKDEDVVLAGDTIRVPFTCSCDSNQRQLSHTFTYDSVNASDTGDVINRVYYHGLSRADQITSPAGPELYPGQPAFVPVRCSCGDPKNPRFGLFITYAVKQNDTKEQIAADFNTTVANLTLYNPSVNLNAMTVDDRLFIPAALLNGTYPEFRGDPSDGSGSNVAVVAGVAAGAAVLVIVLAAVLWFLYRRRKGHPKVRYSQAHLESGLSSAEAKPGSFVHDSNGSGNARGGLSDFAVDKSVEFSYEELAGATDNFNISNKIGEGGYGAVYYGEIRSQKLAIKKMNMQATREFLSELKVLTHVHHTNLVQLIGYCTTESLFLVYEYIDNGTLAHHLRGSGSRLSWNQRIQIALDAARGLEYIHEHTKPTYIHRDVKSPNILIDSNFRAKVADFGLTKLTESAPGGSTSLTQPTRLVGTFGYMPPEYARFGDVSPKIDVYSFGVVLYEIISAKDAIVRTMDADDSEADPSQRILSKGLVTLFDGVLKGPNADEKLRSELVDPSLGSNYPSDSMWKLAKLAEACTQDTPENRPTMRAVVVALMTLCSSTQELDFSSSYSDTHIRDLVTGR